MFSKLSANRFEKEQKTAVGPGAYHVRSFTDLHKVDGSTNLNLERDSLVLDSSSSSFQVFDEAAGDSVFKRAMAPRTPRRQLFGLAKENRIPLGTAFVKANSQEPSCREVYSDPEPHSQQVATARRRSLAEEKMRLQADAKAGDMAVAKKSTARAQAQLQARDRQLAEALKQVDELTAAHAEAKKMAESWQADSQKCRKALHEKDETIAALKKQRQLSKANAEDSGRRPEHEQVRTLKDLTVAQAQRLQSLETVLQDKNHELETTRQQLSDLEERFESYTVEAHAHIQTLTTTQERIKKSVVEMARAGEQQAEEFEEKLAAFHAREVRTDTEAALRHVYLSATLRLLEKEGSSRQQAEVKLTSLQHEAATLETLHDDEKEPHYLRQFAEVQGKLFVAEQQIAMLLAARDQDATSATAAQSLREEEIDVFLALEASCREQHDGSAALSLATEEALESQEANNAGTNEHDVF